MSFQILPAHRLLTLSLLVLPGLSFLFAQTPTDQLKINLDRVKNHYLKVTYIPSEANQEQGILFPSYVQNSYFNIDPLKYVKKPKAFNAEGKRIRVKKNGGQFIPKEGVSYWEYQINGNKFPHTLSEANRLHFRKRKHSFFYPGAFYPYVKANSLKHSIAIRNHISDSLVHIHKFNFENRKRLNAFSFGASRRSISVNDSLGKYSILFHGRFRSLPEVDVQKIIANLISAFQKTTDLRIPENFSFHIIESSHEKSKKNSLPKSSSFGNGISVVLNASNNTFEQKEALIRNTMWQLFRWISPVNCHDGNYDLLHPGNGNQSFHLWYYESVTEYLALVCLLKNRLIDERYFTKIMQEKISKSIEEPNFSLIQLGTEFSVQTTWLEIKNNLKAYDVFTNRGVVASMILDIALLEESEGRTNLLSKFLTIHSDHYPLPFSTARFIGQFVDGHKKDFRFAIEKYILGIDEINYRHYFSLIDWQFFQKGESHKTFIKGGYFTFFPEIDKYLCTRAGKNSVGLEKGDVILSINSDSEISSYDLNEIIMPSRNIRNENRVKLEVLRNGRVMVLRGKAEFDAKVKDDIIIPLFNPSSDGYQLRKALMH